MSKQAEQGQPLADAEIATAQRATHDGVLELGALKIPCAVLADGTRVLSERGVARSLGVYRSGQALTAATVDEGGGRLPLFLSNKGLRPFVDEELALVVMSPVMYRDRKSGRISRGMDARLIPRICEVWLRARDAGALRKDQQGIAGRADMIIRALATVGIIALVDEATGYQRDRTKDALARILEQFISKDLERWARVFPDDFYRELFRLRGWTVSDIAKRPGHTAALTNDIVYLRLAPGVLDALKKEQERNEQGRPKHKLHQKLTPEYGRQRLREHLWAVIALMKASANWPGFQRVLNRALPRQDIPPDLFPGEGYAAEPEEEE